MSSTKYPPCEGRVKNGQACPRPGAYRVPDFLDPPYTEDDFRKCYCKVHINQIAKGRE